MFECSLDTYILFNNIYMIKKFTIAALMSIVSASYNETLAKEAWSYSAASYLNESLFANWTCGVAACPDGVNSSDVIIIEAAYSAFGFVAYNARNNTIIVAFRGTINGNNWKTNLNAWVYVAYPYSLGARAHRGFSNAFNRVAPAMIEAVTKFLKEHPDAKLLCTGHSLGGALASLAAMELKRLNMTGSGLSVYTFGAPRLGNRALATFVFDLFEGSNFYRVVNSHDVVPRLGAKVGVW
jgi:hypothetical protein